MAGIYIISTHPEHEDLSPHRTGIAPALLSFASAPGVVHRSPATTPGLDWTRVFGVSAIGLVQRSMRHIERDRVSKWISVFLRHGNGRGEGTRLEEESEKMEERGRKDRRPNV